VVTNDPSPLPRTLPDTPVGLSEHGTIDLPRVFTPDDPPWGLGKALLSWFISVACLLLVPLVLIIPYFVYLALTTGVPETIAQDKTFLVLSILGVIPAHALTLAAVWPLITNWGRFPFWRSFGFTWPPSLTPWKGVGLCFAVAALLLLLGLVVTNFVGGGKTQLDALIESSYQARIAVAFLAFATAPLVEEVVYRGILYPTLRRALGVAWAIIIISFLFAGVHVLQYYNNIGVIIVITILSITLTVIRAWSGRLLPTVVIHLIFNGIQSLILVFEPLVRKSENITPSVPGFTQLSALLNHLF